MMCNIIYTWGEPTDETSIYFPIHKTLICTRQNTLKDHCILVSYSDPRIWLMREEDVH